MKSVLLFIFLLFGTAAFAQTRVLMMIPNDFMWPEYEEPRKVYEAAGFKVTTAGMYLEEMKPDRRNKKVYPTSRPIKVDITFDQVNVKDYDAITFVGGNGSWHDFFPSQRVHDIVKAGFQENKVVGLLCASTGLLGLVGNWDGNGQPIAQGKKAVGYFRVAGIMKNLGKVNFIDGGVNEPGVVADGNLVTGRNFESAKIFGEKIVEVVRNKK